MEKNTFLTVIVLVAITSLISGLVGYKMGQKSTTCKKDCSNCNGSDVNCSTTGCTALKDCSTCTSSNVNCTQSSCTALKDCSTCTSSNVSCTQATCTALKDCSTCSSSTGVNCSTGACTTIYNSTLTPISIKFTSGTGANSSLKQDCLLSGYILFDGASNNLLIPSQPNAIVFTSQTEQITSDSVSELANISSTSYWVTWNMCSTPGAVCMNIQNGIIIFKTFSSYSNNAYYVHPEPYLAYGCSSSESNGPCEIFVNLTTPPSFRTTCSIT